MRTAEDVRDADKQFLIDLPGNRVLHFWEGGDPAGSPILIHHGCPGGRLAASTGNDAARRQGVRLLSFSRPGYGRSTDTRRSLASVGADSLLVANELGVAEFAVLGGSAGGPYSIATGLADPSRVRAVGVVAGVAPWPIFLDAADDDREDLRLWELARAGDEPSALDGFRVRIRAEYAGLLELDDGAMIEAVKAANPAEEAGWLDAATSAAYVADKREALQTYDGAARDVVAMGLDWDITPTDLKVPTWLWYGDRDKGVPATNGRWLTEQIPGSTLIIRPGKGHGGTIFGFWDDMLSILRDQVRPNQAR